MAPGYVALINLVLILILYLFIWRVVKAIYIDIYERPVPYAEAREVMEQQQKAVPREAALEVVKSAYVNEGRVYPLTDLITLGRSTETDIVLRDPLVSHQHSRIVKKLNTWYIMDLGSTNGTYVGKEMITGQTELKNGQKIRIGETVFQVKM
ncbi:MAG: FHA domain-containing protein [Actinomycetota bacterium]